MPPARVRSPLPNAPPRTGKPTVRDTRPFPHLPSVSRTQPPPRIPNSAGHHRARSPGRVARAPRHAPPHRPGPLTRHHPRPATPRRLTTPRHPRPTTLHLLTTSHRPATPHNFTTLQTRIHTHLSPQGSRPGSAHSKICAASRARPRLRTLLRNPRRTASPAPSHEQHVDQPPARPLGVPKNFQPRP